MQLIYTKLLCIRDKLAYKDKAYYFKNSVAYSIKKVTTY